MVLQNRTNSIDTFKIFICKPPIFLWNHLHSSIHLISCCTHATFSFSIQHDMHIMQQQSHDEFIFFPLHSCHWDIFAIGTFSPSGFFAIGISSCDSHRPSPLSAHWQLLRRLITDLPLVTRGARARPAYQQPRHNRPTGLYTHISPAYRQPLANWPIYGLVIGHYLCVLVEPNHTESQVLPGSRKRSTRKSKLFANLLVCRFQKV